MTGDLFGSCGHRARPELSIRGGEVEAGVLETEVAMASSSSFNYSIVSSEDSFLCCPVNIVVT